MSRFTEFVREAKLDNYAPPLMLVCPACEEGELARDGENRTGDLTFVACRKCKTCFTVHA